MPKEEVYTEDGFELTLGRAVMQDHGEHDGLVHLWWRDRSAAERLVQVYVNGELADVIADPQQRELWLIIDRSRPHRIELLAVPADEPDALWQARPDRLSSWDPPIQSSAEALVLRDESLPVDTKIEVAVDGETVAVGNLWPGDAARSGFGGWFGLGDFGQDAASGLGLGRGELGLGPLGRDGTAWRWSDPTLKPGPHVVTLTAKSVEGRRVSPPAHLPVAVDALPPAAALLASPNDFTLAWTD